MIPPLLLPIANHLWQSTLFAGTAGLITLALRENSARVRHWVWVAASLKFLVPFSVLIAIGSRINWGTAPAIVPNVSVVVEQVSRPFALTTVSSPMPATAPTGPSELPEILFGIWACGFIGISISWWVRWRRIAAAVRGGSPVQLDLPIRAISSGSFLEPGVFGVFRPVLLLPDGIFEHLTPEQWRSVVAHELCHVRHRDNLVANLQMFVETVYWFYPLVWWIGKRIFQERETACDEEVLRLGSEPSAYAQSILRVCELYLESPLECVAGVTGSNLKRRIRDIMTQRRTRRMNTGKKLLVAAAGVVAVTGPIIIGVLNLPLIQAQSAPAGTPKFDAVSVKRISPQPPGSHSSEKTNLGRLLMTGNMHRFIVRAYGVTDAQLGGEPEWFRAELYSIEAVTSARASVDQMMLMLRDVLAERFKLKLRQEYRDLSVFTLEVAVGGPKFRELMPGENPPHLPEPPGTLAKGFTSVKSLVDSLNGVFGGRLTLDRPVVDRTGLRAQYDIQLRTELETQSDDFGRTTLLFPNLLRDMQSELGLKLVPERVKMPYLVVENAEAPTPN
jgi:bla regulator protein blaR1